MLKGVTVATSKNTSAFDHTPGRLHIGLLNLMLGFVFLPVFLLGAFLAPFGRREVEEFQTASGKLISVSRWCWGGLLGKWFNAGAVSLWCAAPLLLRGQMAWIGPLATSRSGENEELHVAPPPFVLNWLAQIPPGFMSPWTAMKHHLPQSDFRDVELGYFLHRSFAGDLSLIVNCISQSFFKSQAFNCPSSIVFDTLRVDNLSIDQATQVWTEHLSSPEGAGPNIVAFVNARVVNAARRAIKVRRAYNGCQIVLPEGEYLQTAAKLLKSRLRSTAGRHSFLHRALEVATQQGAPIFVLAGDDPQACAQAIQRQYPALQVAGTASTQSSGNPDDHWSTLIQKSGARLVILSMANPNAITWLSEQHPYLGAWTVVCPGVLSVESDPRIPLIPPPTKLRWWATQKFYLAVLLQRWLGGVTPEAPQHRGKTGGESTIPQRAYVMALSASQDSLVQDLSAVPALIPVGSQSLLAMHMEQMAAVRCQQIELITDADPIRFREIVNEGERWGLAVTLHLASDASDAFKRLQLMLRMETLRDSTARPVWLVDASRWIPDGITVPEPSQPSNALWLDTGGAAAPDTPEWAGYAKLDLALLARLCACPHWDDVGTRLTTYEPDEGDTHPLPCHRIPARGTHLQALPGLVAAMEMARMGVLDQPNWVRVPVGEHVKGEVWRAKTAVVDELAVCEGPAFIGPYSVVAAHAQVGPHVVLGAHVCLENGVEIKHSVVLPGVTVGQGLDITHSLVGLSGISSLSWNSFVPSQALGHLLQPTHTIVKKVGWPERAVALVLLLLVPALSLLPGARAQSPLGRAFRSRFRPQLITVLWGAHALVGRSSETSSLVATDWRDLASDPLGVIAVGDTWGAEGVDEHLIADLYWSVNQNWPQRWALLRGYLRALGTGKTVSLVSDNAA
jgi:UDP-N-acetyl-D-mannosaminuronic acid transferase (WecB/TagA/CpsF family)